MSKETAAEMIRERATGMTRKTAAGMTRKTAAEMIREMAAGMIREMAAEMVKRTAEETVIRMAAGMVKEPAIETAIKSDIKAGTKKTGKIKIDIKRTTRAMAEAVTGTTATETATGKGTGTIIELKEDERIDDLQRNGRQIIQKKKGFCFGMDAVLLSGFARAFQGEHVFDIGTGTGIIPILMEAKTEGSFFVGLEIQEEIADMARRSVALNGSDEKIKIVTGDIRGASSLFSSSSFDVITSNPPYMDHAHGLENPDRVKAIARHEILCTLEDVVREAGRMVRPGGRFYLVHRPRRLIQIINVLSKYGMEPKRMKFVHPFVDREANMVLIEAVRGGKPMLKLEKPVIVFKEPGVYTDEIKSVYGY